MRGSPSVLVQFPPTPPTISRDVTTSLGWALVSPQPLPRKPVLQVGLLSLATAPRTLFFASLGQ